jgi:biopolymer transport protein ExbB/TolQ
MQVLREFESHSLRIFICHTTNAPFNMELITLITGASISIFSIFLGSFLSRRQAKDQFLMETKRTVYAKVLSAAISEDKYPPDILGTAEAYFEEKVTEYNRRLLEWRKNRKVIKGLAAEALLVTQGEVLRNKLSDFISSNDPDKNLQGLEGLMRKEIGIQNTNL